MTDNQNKMSFHVIQYCSITRKVTQLAKINFAFYSTNLGVSCYRNIS